MAREVSTSSSRSSRSHGGPGVVAFLSQQSMKFTWIYISLLQSCGQSGALVPGMSSHCQQNSPPAKLQLWDAFLSWWIVKCLRPKKADRYGPSCKLGSVKRLIFLKSSFQLASMRLVLLGFYVSLLEKSEKRMSSYSGYCRMSTVLSISVLSFLVNSMKQPSSLKSLRAASVMINAPPHNIEKQCSARICDTYEEIHIICISWPWQEDPEFQEDCISKKWLSWRHFFESI